MREEKILGEGDFLQLVCAGQWEYTRRINCSGAVCIIAVTEQHELVLIEQMRAAVNCMVIELPAGLVGDHEAEPDESFVTAGLRELEEEAGYRATAGELLFSFPSCAGLSAESIAMVRATGLTEVHAGGGVGSEDIRRVLVPVPELAAWLAAQHAAGAAIDPKVYLAAFLVSHSK